MRIIDKLVNAWIWSSVFHTRDLPWTEKMDYFSAMFVLLVSLLPATYRAFRLDLKPASQRSNIILFISSVSLVFFIFHISYLSFKSFDYGYNMTACLVVAAILNILWMSRFLLHFKVDNNQKALFFTIVISSFKILINLVLCFRYEFGTFRFSTYLVCI